MISDLVDRLLEILMAILLVFAIGFFVTFGWWIVFGDYGDRDYGRVSAEFTTHCNDLRGHAKTVNGNGDRTFLCLTEDGRVLDVR